MPYQFVAVVLLCLDFAVSDCRNAKPNVDNLKLLIPADTHANRMTTTRTTNQTQLPKCQVQNNASIRWSEQLVPNSAYRCLQNTFSRTCENLNVLDITNLNDDVVYAIINYVFLTTHIITIHYPLFNCFCFVHCLTQINNKYPFWALSLGLENPNHSMANA